MPKEYIERENLLRQMRDSKVDKPPYGNWDIAHDCCIDIAENIATADVVEVVRCKDCRYYSDTCGHCNLHLNPSVEMNNNDFCSYGDRKDK